MSIFWMGWIITQDGKRAWRWENPAISVEIEDADKFIAEHPDEVLKDDRGEIGGNVWD